MLLELGVFAPVFSNVRNQSSSLRDTFSLHRDLFIFIPNLQIWNLPLELIFTRLLQAIVSPEICFAPGVVFDWWEKFGVGVVSSYDKTLVSKHFFTSAFIKTDRGLAKLIAKWYLTLLMLRTPKILEYLREVSPRSGVTLWLLIWLQLWKLIFGGTNLLQQERVIHI